MKMVIHTARATSWLRGLLLGACCIVAMDSFGSQSDMRRALQTAEANFKRSRTEAHAQALVNAFNNLQSSGYGVQRSDMQKLEAVRGLLNQAVQVLTKAEAKTRAAELADAVAKAKAEGAKAKAAELQTKIDKLDRDLKDAFAQGESDKHYIGIFIHKIAAFKSQIADLEAKMAKAGEAEEAPSAADAAALKLAQDKIGLATTVTVALQTVLVATLDEKIKSELLKEIKDLINRILTAKSSEEYKVAHAQWTTLSAKIQTALLDADPAEKAKYLARMVAVANDALNVELGVAIDLLGRAATPVNISAQRDAIDKLLKSGDADYAAYDKWKTEWPNLQTMINAWATTARNNLGVRTDIPALAGLPASISPWPTELAKTVKNARDYFVSVVGALQDVIDAEQAPSAAHVKSARALIDDLYNVDQVALQGRIDVVARVVQLLADMQAAKALLATTPTKENISTAETLLAEYRAKSKATDTKTIAEEFEKAIEAARKKSGPSGDGAPFDQAAAEAELNALANALADGTSTDVQGLRDKLAAYKAKVGPAANAELVKIVDDVLSMA